MLDIQFHISRREKLLEFLKDGQAGIFFAGSTKMMAGDEEYPFSVNRNFFYLTGCEEPDTVYLAYRQKGAGKEVLFIRRPDPRLERYEGPRPGKAEAGQKYGIAEVCFLDELSGRLAELISCGGVGTLLFDQEEGPWQDMAEPVRQTADRLKKDWPRLAVENAAPWFARMRRVKQPEEIAAHRIACRTTVEAVRYMMAHTRPEMTEGQMEAYFDFIVKSRGCGHAFATVAATGKNACILHYSANRDKIKKGDLVLVDLGASWEYYCADVSRTFPANGKFTPRQKLLYEIVLAGLTAALEAAKPGQRKDELQLISKRVMADELVKAGILSAPEEIDKYYLYGSGHFIGLYTHDVGEDPENLLQKDMMFTLEPGLYFPEEGIGIRIEDTLLVTEDGCEVLTAGIPKTVEEIEAFMQS